MVLVDEKTNHSNNEIILQSTIQQDDITKRVSNAFDYEFNGTVETIIKIPDFPKEFNIGLIVGSSGSGKSTLLRQFGEIESVEWDNSKCIASHFDSFEDASYSFGAVGLNSIPTWLKPYNVLSTGEKFRADMARSLHNDALIDEFTSVVNRECAVSCSLSISKYIKSHNLKNIVFASCHDDIIDYLNPDWIYYTDRHELVVGRSLRHKQQQIVLEVSQCAKQVWDMFKAHHYLSAELNPAADCYLVTYNDRPVAFQAVLPMPGRFGDDPRKCYSGHRLVVLPDFQGMGIGNSLSEYIGELYTSQGYRYFTKTANPRIGEHRDKSSKWRSTSSNKKKKLDISQITDDMIKRNQRPKGRASTVKATKLLLTRICYSHEYIGDGNIVVSAQKNNNLF